MTDRAERVAAAVEGALRRRRRMGVAVETQRATEFVLDAFPMAEVVADLGQTRKDEHDE